MNECFRGPGLLPRRKTKLENGFSCYGGQAWHKSETVSCIPAGMDVRRGLGHDWWDVRGGDKRNTPVPELRFAMKIGPSRAGRVCFMHSGAAEQTLPFWGTLETDVGRISLREVTIHSQVPLTPTEHKKTDWSKWPASLLCFIDLEMGRTYCCREREVGNLLVPWIHCWDEDLKEAWS